MGEIFAGRYELVDPIGRGGTGAVWRSWDHRRQRYVAAKVLQQSDAHSLLRFVREQALRIDHPHVLAPTSWAADDDKVLFTMDLVTGGSLAHLIRDHGPLPPVRVCTLLDQLLSGLAAVHAEDVLHRDIKPANVLMAPTGTGRPHLRLSDFGISVRKGEPRLTDANFVLGTPGYFAPEQMMGSDPDFTADLYAVGLVGLYLLTSVKPDPKELLLRYEHGMPDPPSGVPEPLWQILGQLLQPDPLDRFRTATGVRKALASAVELLPPDPARERQPIDVRDQLGPLPEGYGPEGPLHPAPEAHEGEAEAHEDGAGGAQRTGAARGTGAVGSADGSAAGSAAPSGSPTPAPPTPPTAPPPATHTAGSSHPPPAGERLDDRAPGAQASPTPQLAPPGPTPAGGAADGPQHGAPVPAGRPAPDEGMPVQPPSAPGEFGRPYETGAGSRPTTVLGGTRHTSADAPPQTSPSPGPSKSRSRVPRGSSGPPRQVAVPVLIVAVLCIGFGVWALLAA